MFLHRCFSRCATRRTQIDIHSQVEAVIAHHIPNLPVQSSIAISSQDLSRKVTTDDKKPPVVLVHGLFGAKQNYSSVARQISNLSSRKTIGVDMRNHGASAHAFPHDYDHMARDTIRYLESLGRPVILAGHSMGAKVSMLVALQRPDLMEKLIVIDNSPTAETLDTRFTRDLLAMCRVERELHSDGKNQVSLLKDVDRIMKSYEPDALVRIFLASNLQRPSKKSNLSEKVKFRVPVANFLKHDVLSKMGDWPTDLVRGLTFDKPVLVMRGLESEFISNTHLNKHFPTYFTDFRTVDFHCGHWLVSEQPEKFVEETLKFIKDD